MSAPFKSDMFQFVHVLSTKVTEKTKSVLLQVGSNIGKGLVEAEDVKQLNPYGFASRPPKTILGSAKSAAATLLMRVGNFDLALGSFDERGQGLYGNLAEGESAMFGGGSDGEAQGRILIKKNGSLNFYTKKGNSSSGAGMLIQMDPTDDSIRLLNSKGYGLIIDEDGVRVTAEKSALTLSKSGKCSLIGTGMCQMDGSTVLLGAIAVPVINSICVGPAGLVGVASGKCLASLV